MHNLVLSVVISVWIFTDSSVNGAITISYEGSKKLDSTTYSLKCAIPVFNSLAGWSRAGSSIATCTSSGCNPTSTASYTFRHDASAIYVDFDTLANSENGIQWICEHFGDTSVSFDVQIDFGSENSAGKLETGLIVLICFGIVVAVVGGFYLIVCIWMFVVGRNRNEIKGEKEAIDVCCCACCCACCSSFLMCVTCHLFVNRKKTKIDPEDVEEVYYVKKNRNIEFGKHIQNTTNAKWEKDGKEVVTTHREFTMFKIDNASVNHEGLYICTFGPNNLKQKYYLIVVGRTEMVYVKEGQEAELGKTILGIDAVPAVKWMKDEHDVNPDYLVGTKLKIGKASLHDQGKYVCTFGTTKNQLTYLLIIVGRTEMVYVKEDQEVELGKTIPGIDVLPAVKWMKDKHDVNPDYLVGNKLKIKKASLHDEGKYVCTFGTEKNKLTYLLIIVGTEETINVIEGKQIKFGKDIPDSDATSDAYWTKDGLQVESTSQKKTFYQIDAVDENSKGLYVCHLGNKAELKYRLLKYE